MTQMMWGVRSVVWFQMKKKCIKPAGSYWSFQQSVLPSHTKRRSTPVLMILTHRPPAFLCTYHQNLFPFLALPVFLATLLLPTITNIYPNHRIPNTPYQHKSKPPHHGPRSPTGSAWKARARTHMLPPIHIQRWKEIYVGGPLVQRQTPLKCDLLRRLL